MAQQVKAVIDTEKKVLRLEIPLLEKAQPSSTGKMLMIASSGGYQSPAGAEIDGKPVRVNVMVGIRQVGAAP